MLNTLPKNPSLLDGNGFKKARELIYITFGFSGVLGGGEGEGYRDKHWAKIGLEFR